MSIQIEQLSEEEREEIINYGIRTSIKNIYFFN